MVHKLLLVLNKSLSTVKTTDPKLKLGQAQKSWFPVKCSNVYPASPVQAKGSNVQIPPRIGDPIQMFQMFKKNYESGSLNCTRLVWTL